jgi:hypothetical protein
VFAEHVQYACKVTVYCLLYECSFGLLAKQSMYRMLVHKRCTAATTVEHILTTATHYDCCLYITHYFYSGLDARSAQVVMRAIRKVAATGRAVM